MIPWRAERPYTKYIGVPPGDSADELVFNWVLMRVMGAVKETIADVSSVSPSSERANHSLWQWANARNVSYCLFHGAHYPHQHSVDTVVYLPPRPRSQPLKELALHWFCSRTSFCWLRFLATLSRRLKVRAISNSSSDGSEKKERDKICCWRLRISGTKKDKQCLHISYAVVLILSDIDTRKGLA